jgi:hypothetical protein
MRGTPLNGASGKRGDVPLSWPPELRLFDLDDLRSAYDRAVRAGAWLDRDEARTSSCARLLAQAVRTTPALSALAGVFEAGGDSGRPSERLADELARVAAFGLYTLDLALGRHARDVGYDPETWRQTACTVAHAIASSDQGESGAPLAFELVNEALDVDAQLIVALYEDRGAVPALLAEALARLLLVRTVATTATEIASDH